MTRNASSAHDPAASVRSAGSVRRAAWRRWLTRPGGSVRTWIKRAVAAVLIIILLSFVDWWESLLLLADVQLLPALCACALLVAGLALSTVKWQVLLAAHDVRVSLLRLLNYYWIGYFFNNFLPSNVGGDFVRLTLMYNQGSMTIVGASIFAERLTGFFVLLCFGAVGLAALSQNIEEAGVLLPMWLLIVILSGALGAAVLFGGKIGTWSRTPQPDRLIGRLILTMIKVAKDLAYYRQKMKAVCVSLFISVLFYINMILFQYSLILSIGGDVSLLDVAFVAPLIALVAFIPISVNALGLAEGAFVVFFTQVGLSPEEALAAALLRRVLIFSFSLVGGVTWLWEKPRLQSAQ